MLRRSEYAGLWQIRDTATARRAATIRDMGRWEAWLARAGLATLLLATLLLTPLADAQAAHLQVGHGSGQPAAAGHPQHGAAGEHSHEHHHTVLHAAGTMAQPPQPELLTRAAAFIPVPPGAGAEPAPPTDLVRDTGRSPQALLQVWRI